MKLPIKITALSLCLLTALSCFLGCKKKEGLITDEENLLSSYSRSASVPTYNFNESADLMPENYGIYSEASKSFALALLKENLSDKENVVLSPLAVSELLALLANGAASQTSQNLRNTVASTLSISDLNISNYYLRQRLESISTDDSLSCSVSLWLNNRFDVKSSFLQTAADYFSAGIIRTDFDGENFYEKVNGYVNEQNSGKKQGEVSDISSDHMMFALCDVFAEDRWVTPIDNSKLSSGTFFGTNGQSNEVYMTSSESYISSDIAEGFKKNLKNTPLRFVAIMPKEDMSLDEFLEFMTASRFEELMVSDTPAGKKSVAVPLFYAETDKSLNQSLDALGCTRAFDSQNSNFSDLSGSDKVRLDNLLHFSSISISPEGISREQESFTANLQSSDAELVFDRPFIFAVCDNESNIPVFIGAITTDP